MPYFVAESGERKFIHSVITTYSGGKVVYLDRNRQPILCSQGTVMNPEPTNNTQDMIDSQTPSGFGEFTSMSPERKQQVLKARADGNFKKEIAPRKEQMLKDLSGR